MKIVNICLAGPFSDGWSYQENLLTKYQKRNGNEVDVMTSQYTWNSDGKIELVSENDYVNEFGVHIYRLPIKNKKNINYRFKRYEGLNQRLEISNPDVLFIHGCQFLDIATIVSYLKKYPNVRVFVDNHADFSNSASGWLSKNILHKIIWRHFAQKINPYVRKWYGVLPARVDFLRDVYKIPAEKIEFLPMGADDDLVEKYSTKEVRQEYRKKYGIDDDDFLIVTGGKIDLAKKQTLLLMDAVNQINNPRIKLIVFGSIVPELKEEVIKKCSEKVRYIGWISSEQSYPHFAMADLVVFPGRHSVFWEQVAGQGIPMVVKYWPGTTHVNRDGCVEFLNNDSVDEIKSKIEELCAADKIESIKNIAQRNRDFFLYSHIANESILF